MKNLFESWREHLREGDVVPIRPGIESDMSPRVEAKCECHDCVFNRDYLCSAEKIELDFAQVEGGRWICECKTYKVTSGEEKGPEDDELEESAWSGSGPLAEPIEET